MPLLLPPDYLHNGRLKAQDIIIETSGRTADIRVALFNIMPRAEEYEFMLLNRLGRSQLLVEPLFFRAERHHYGSSNQEHLNRYYQSSAMLALQSPDAVLLTGAPVEHLSPDQIHYQDEIDSLMLYCCDSNTPLLGICWGGIAVCRFLGVGSEVYQDKLSGVFRSANLAPEHPLMRAFGTGFYCPQSRFAGLVEKEVQELSKSRIVRPLAVLPEYGTFLLESADGLFTAHLGHPEYLPGRLVFEYNRDVLSNPSLHLTGFDPSNPVDNWSDESDRFFCYWLESVKDSQFV